MHLRPHLRRRSTSGRTVHEPLSRVGEQLMPLAPQTHVREGTPHLNGVVVSFPPLGGSAMPEWVGNAEVVFAGEGWRASAEDFGERLALPVVELSREQTEKLFA